MMIPPLTRRAFQGGLAAAALAPMAARAQTGGGVLARKIPHTGEALPAVGLGTAVAYNSDGAELRVKAAAVLEALIASGGRLVDTGSTYGDAETVLGAVIAAGKIRDRLFVATKLESANPDELRRSLSRLQMTSVDLLQYHNIRRADQSLAQFREWKAQGICRTIGITSTYRSDLPALEAVLAREKPDFVQVDYSIDNREAEQRLLPIAADVGAGVLTALPFGRNRLFRAVKGKELPDWARPFADSWAQFFLKYLLADPRVTAVIPGTNDAGHMTDNAGAMRGPLPDASQRERMRATVDAL